MVERNFAPICLLRSRAFQWPELATLALLRVLIAQISLDLSLKKLTMITSPPT